jgi:integrase
VWSIPAENGGQRRTKNNRPHVVPLTDAMLAILDARKAEQKLLATEEKPMPPFVFTTTGTTPFSGFSRGKRLLDARIAKAQAQAGEGEPPPWRIHDLRRSVATHMAEDLRIAPHIIEAVLNHISGTKGGVAGIYNRALHIDERRDALEAWSRGLLAIVGETEADNVVELRGQTQTA